MVRLYDLKLNVFEIYNQLRPELSPGLEDDIFIQKVKYMVILSSFYLPSTVSGTSNVFADVTDFKLPVVAGKNYIISGYLILSTSVGGTRLTFTWPGVLNSSISLFGSTTTANLYVRSGIAVSGTDNFVSYNVNTGGFTVVWVSGTVCAGADGFIQLQKRSVTSGQTTGIKDLSNLSLQLID